jgi:CBS domain-containing protein
MKINRFTRLSSRRQVHERTPPMKLRDVMTPRPQTLGPNATIQEAARVMRDSDTGIVPIVDQGKPIGIITDRDIVVRAVAEGPGALGRPVRDLASTDLVTASPELSTRDAVRLMGEHQVRRLLVCEDDVLVGVASIGDIAVKEGKDKRVGDTLETISQGVKEEE